MITKLTFSRIAAVLCILLCASLLGAQSQRSPGRRARAINVPTSSAPGQSGEALAELLGERVTADQLTSNSHLIETSEGNVLDDPGVLLDDYIIQKVVNDVFTTVPVDKSYASLPTKYPFPSQRRYLINRLREDVQSKIPISRPELEAWHREHVKDFSQPERVTANYIFMGTSADNPTSSPEKVRERMKKVKAEADAGTSFGLLAQKYSEASSGAVGGDLGLLTYRVPIGPANKPINIILDDALFKLKTGQVSDVLETPRGMHLLYARDHQTTISPSIEDMTTSGILPNSATAEKVTEALRQLTTDTLKRNHARILAEAGELTTGSLAYEFGGKKWTIHDLEVLYGTPFTNAYQNVRGNKESLNRIIQQIMEEQGLVVEALDRKLDQQPQARHDLDYLGERARSVRRMQEILAAESPVNEPAARKFFEENKNSWRRPELQGRILTLKAQETTDPVERVKAQDALPKKAEEIHKRLKGGEDFDAVAREVSKDDRTTSGGSVERHAVGTLGDEAGQRFDQMVMQMQEGEMTDPRLLGPGVMAIARLEKRWPGEPPPFNDVKPRILRMLSNQSILKLRQDIVQMAIDRGAAKWLPGAAKVNRGPKATGK